MMRDLFIVEHVDVVEGYDSRDTVAYSSYEKAVQAFKAKIAEVILLDRIHDAALDAETPTVSYVFDAYYGEEFKLYGRAGEKIDDIPANAKAFTEWSLDGTSKCEGELTFDFCGTLIILKAVKEES